MADFSNRNMNLRTAKMSGSEGKNPTDNPGIMPGATPETPCQKATNETTQYWGGKGKGQGPWGGEAANK